MNEFQGKKWYCSSVKLVKNENAWWKEEYKEVKEYRMTGDYRKYLQEKKKKEFEEELRVLKNKLEYQKKTYGEVDEIDFQEYQAKIRRYYQ